MNKTALYIPRPGDTSLAIQRGYVDALLYLGWTVYVCDPKTKLGCRTLIENFGVRLIMTSSRYGMRQLPIQVINDNNVVVMVNALPINTKNLTVNGPYEFAHDDEPDLVKEIESVIVHTNLEQHLWSEYMCGWTDSGVGILFVPVAGNMIKALPPTCSTLVDVAMVANFNHRQGVMRYLIDPLFKRLDLLGYSYQAFGDNIWELAGLQYNGPLVCDSTRLANIYATAKVCPNVHTEQQIGLQACVNERSFMIPLCGGMQVSDNPMTSKYLGEHCEIAVSTTDFMNKVTRLIEDQTGRSQRIKDAVEHVAHHHTYFNRLTDLFSACELTKFADEAKAEGQRAAVRHCWEMDARLNAVERGVEYEQEVIGTS